MRQTDMDSSLFAGRYRLLERIGGGGCGTVFKAFDVKEGCPCAVKILDDPIDGADDRTFLALEREFKLIRRTGSTGHPGIPSVYQVGFQGRQAFIAMCYYEGESLDRRLAREVILPMQETLELFRDILGTVAYLHVGVCRDLMDAEADGLGTDSEGRIVLGPEDQERLVSQYGIIHNDLKANQFVRSAHGGRYVLVDYGLSVQGSSPVRTTYIKAAAGTPGYNAPEKVGGRKPDFRSDVFALGALLFECLTGDVPYPEDDFSTGRAPSIDEARAALFARKFGDRPIARDYLCPAWLSDIVLGCISLDPAGRYPHAGDVLEAFELGMEANRGRQGATEQEFREELDEKERSLECLREVLRDNEGQIRELDGKVRGAEKRCRRTRRARNALLMVSLALVCFIGYGFLHGPSAARDSGCDEHSWQTERSVPAEIISSLEEQLRAATESNRRMHHNRDSLEAVLRELADSKRMIDSLHAIQAASGTAPPLTASSMEPPPPETGGPDERDSRIAVLSRRNADLWKELRECRKAIDSLKAYVCRYRDEMRDAANRL